MQIIINIPDETYHKIACRTDGFIHPLDERIIGQAICAGIRLPKNLNGLISEDVLDKFKKRIMAYGKNYSFSGEEVLNILGRYEGIYKKESISNEIYAR